jgi:hypothetical protein
MSHEYSGDQYQADYDSRYPAFSDYNTTDARLADPIGQARGDRPARVSRQMTPEGQYQMEQQDIPVYRPCHNKCVSCEWPRHAELRPYTLEQREYKMMLEEEARMAKCRQAPACPKVAPANGTVESMVGGLTADSNVLLVFMFIMFVTICYCVKALIELRAEVKNLRKNTNVNV